MKGTLEIIRYAVIALEILTAIIASVHFRKYKGVPRLRYLPLLVWITALTEVFGVYLSILQVKNYALYNAHSHLSILFYLWMFEGLVRSNRSSKWIKIMAGIYVLLSLYNWTFLQNFMEDLEIFPYLAGSLFLIISIVLFLLETLNSEGEIKLRRHLMFWLSAGLLLYYTGGIPFFTAFSFIDSIDSSMYLISYGLTVVLDSCFIIGFVWSKEMN